MNRENAFDTIPAILPSAGSREPERSESAAGTLTAKSPPQPPHPPDVKTVPRYRSAGRAERL